MMSKQLDFYFDFSSPYGYLASQRIETIADKHNRTVQWHPVLLGFIFKVTESKPLVSFPLKGEYSIHDMKRCAREFNIPFELPQNFPIGTVAAARAVLWAKQAHPDSATALIHALYKRYFVDGEDISDVQQVLDCATLVGIEAEALSTALQNDEVKAMLKSSVDAAVAKGVFGSPFIIVDDEPFWGHDRLEHVSRWLDSGGW